MAEVIEIPEIVIGYRDGFLFDEVMKGISYFGSSQDPIKVPINNLNG